MIESLLLEDKNILAERKYQEQEEFACKICFLSLDEEIDEELEN